jgi:hypothetical protein
MPDCLRVITVQGMLHEVTVVSSSGCDLDGERAMDDKIEAAASDSPTSRRSVEMAWFLITRMSVRRAWTTS